MKTSVYVDGFNIYYALKDSPYKWLDIGKLCNIALKTHTVARIKYFTARVSARPGDLQKPARQDAYLRALRTIPHLEIHEGRFLTKKANRLLVTPLADGTRFVEVWETQEKGSDVNLATHLLVDGFRSEYELAVVISNDSDLAAPISFVRHELDIPVGILNPHEKTPSAELHRVAHFQRPIWERSFRQSQFPPVLHDARGPIRKPERW